ncbi:3-mercaptopyruvate sulfurtransferase [Granulosicoccus sp. 3-233]|uniref:3-mercaptopyruvate sulfurtransferase n=1 Tax=Granulosicoccus sp. 3-233 TaxID=3417969 RepID=UPI003D32DC4C
MNDRPLVTAGWLHDHLHDETVRIIDTSWHMPASGRDSRAEHERQHVPGAVFFDLDQHSSPSQLPHMMPGAEQFSRVMSQLGISESHCIVVYDSLGLFSAARLWWMLRHFGARQVFVLDGGLPAWLQAGFPLESGVPEPEPAHFSIGQAAFAVASSTDVLKASQTGESLVLDARSEARFLGEEKEVRPGLRSGHVPGSVSMPFTDLLDNGFLKPNEQLRTILTSRGVSSERAVITTCGSGVTAAIISLALECIGVSDVALYDGSWTEWGALEDMPVASG